MIFIMLDAQVVGALYHEVFVYFGKNMLRFKFYLSSSLNQSEDRGLGQVTSLHGPRNLRAGPASGTTRNLATVVIVVEIW